MDRGNNLIKLICHPSLFFFFNDTATTEIYTLSLHDALPIYWAKGIDKNGSPNPDPAKMPQVDGTLVAPNARSEEHTSELQSHSDLVCRLLLEKKKKEDTKPAGILESNENNAAPGEADGHSGT